MKQDDKKTGRQKATTLILAVLIITSAQTACAQNTNGDRISEYITSQPLDPEIAAHLKEVLDSVANGDSKLYMEISRRIDFYFYVSGEVDDTMKMFRETLIPYMYQKTSFRETA